MEDDVAENTPLALAEERLRLEREQIAVERERLTAERAHAEAAARLAQARRSIPAAVGAALLAAVAGLLGAGLGYWFAESRHQSQREARLSQALSHIGDLKLDSTRAAPVTNLPASVSVVVIQ